MRFYRLQSLFISMKICIAVTDVVMVYLFPPKCYMYVTCGRNNIYDMTVSTEYWLCHVIKMVLEKMKQKKPHTRQNWSAVVCQKV